MVNRLMGLLLLIFIVIPIVEIWLLITVGGEIGAFPTIGLIILTAVVGVLMIRWQGLTTLLRAKQRLGMGEVPASEMLEGVMLALAGVMLLVPGFATDALGFACLVPPVRRWLAGLWLARGAGVQMYASVHRHHSAGDKSSNDSLQGGNRTIEGDFTREEEQAPKDK